ncbi:26816_t:CDS:2, partial [Dentiscutata erythropus]
QENKVHKLARKCGEVPENLPTILQNPEIAALVLKYLKGDDEMPALVIGWNDAGFNDTATPNLHNGVAGQTKAAIIADLIAGGAIDFQNHNILFIFRSDIAFGSWAENVETNLRWYGTITYILVSLALAQFYYSFSKRAKNQAGVPNVYNAVIRINKVSPSTGANFGKIVIGINSASS